jgi:hypothetical protein
MLHDYRTHKATQSLFALTQDQPFSVTDKQDPISASAHHQPHPVEL